ncbi:MAG: methyltransferase type 11, partial [Firmicutes bacterium]|nr:methyltransferase type 11 [Bacillota bacterium]
MKCIICNNKSDGITKIFSHKILQKYEIEYNQCLQCGLIFTETPYWLSEAYNDSISVRDTGILRRNISYSMDVNIIITLLLKRNARQCSFLDYAGGF